MISYRKVTDLPRSRNQLLNTQNRCSTPWASASIRIPNIVPAFAAWSVDYILPSKYVEKFGSLGLLVLTPYLSFPCATTSQPTNQRTQSQSSILGVITYRKYNLLHTVCRPLSYYQRITNGPQPRIPESPFGVHSPSKTNKSKLASILTVIIACQSRSPGHAMRVCGTSFFIQQCTDKIELLLPTTPNRSIRRGL